MKEVVKVWFTSVIQFASIQLRITLVDQTLTTSFTVTHSTPADRTDKSLAIKELSAMWPIFFTLHGYSRNGWVLVIGEGTTSHLDSPCGTVPRYRAVVLA